MKYRSKELVVDAIQFVPGTRIEGVNEFDHGNGVITGQLVEASVTLQPGDWCVTYSDGSREGFSPDRFAESFEVIPAPEG